MGVGYQNEQGRGYGSAFKDAEWGSWVLQRAWWNGEIKEWGKKRKNRNNRSKIRRIWRGTGFLGKNSEKLN